MTAPAITVVVLNHNYAEYLPAAIDSALAQTYPVDVLVVDDGSTDDSRAVIEGYGDRIRHLFKENGGNSSAVNAAVPATSGDVVMFLDADDLLHEDAAAAVAAAWDESCSKVQFRLSLVDAAGRRHGVDPAGDVPLPDGDVVGDLVTRGRYVTPVTTGNAFRRTVLTRVTPIPEADFRNTNDGYLNLVVPFHGPVVSLDRELGSYRMHGRNLWAFSGRVDLPGARQRIQHDLTRQRQLVRTAAQHGREVVTDFPMQDPEHVLLRLVSLRTDPSGHPVPDDAARTLLLAGLRAAATGEADPVRRATMLLSLPLMAVSPGRLPMRLAELVLLSRPRGPVVRGLARAVRAGLGLVRRRPATAADGSTR